MFIPFRLWRPGPVCLFIAGYRGAILQRPSRYWLRQCVHGTRQPLTGYTGPLHEVRSRRDTVTRARVRLPKCTGYDPEHT